MQTHVRQNSAAMLAGLALTGCLVGCAGAPRARMAPAAASGQSESAPTSRTTQAAGGEPAAGVTASDIPHSTVILPKSADSALPPQILALATRLWRLNHEVLETTGEGDNSWLYSGVPNATLTLDHSSGLDVWEFPTQAAARAAVQNISSSGIVKRPMGSSSMGMPGGMQWPAPPHFFQSGQLVVLYFATQHDRATGADRKALAVLTQVLGPQVAPKP